MDPRLVQLAYLLSAVLFILGLKGLTRPRSAVRGNLLGACGLLVAVVVTLFSAGLDYRLIVGGLVVGSVIGAVFAIRVQMTQMPEMVALFNGFGGAASTLVAGANLMQTDTFTADVLVATALSGVIGAVTFSGSLIAWGKLKEFRQLDKLRIPAQQIVNALLVLFCIALTVGMVNGEGSFWTVVAYWCASGLALILGVTLVVSIGGADMPVVIALLNSYSGLAAAATGFVLSNTVLIVSGALVGASGLILTRIMCIAMNRSLTNVLIGTMGSSGSVLNADDVYANVKSTSAEEVAMLLEVASRVVIVPGYGMAVAQAQHTVSDLRKILTARQINVEFAIHPVAGRMPGHMNVLLAEADVPYEALREMDEINPTMEQVDVTIVLGANDVVNPLARTDPSSPIAGMPIIDVDKSRTVIVIKRSLSPGFAGIPNPLFAADNTLMLFADGRKAIQDIINALNES
ncbi:MAG: NAD(P)(+) transhydrogenase (Re/Si-specific) subunit beta [Rhodopirellula sp.]|nr:NAD(P)(+) transhydrogenase (Re/Si-specific) subunit beta [Rhodopirellula sp.]